MDEEIQRFIRFMNANSNQNMVYDGETGLLNTPDCSGNPKHGCCSESYDLDELYSTLKHLTG